MELYLNGISIFIKLHNILLIFKNIKNITIVMIRVSFSSCSTYIMYYLYLIPYFIAISCEAFLDMGLAPIFQMGRLLEAWDLSKERYCIFSFFFFYDRI